MCTPLWHASYDSFLEDVEWLIASGRDLGGYKKGKYRKNYSEYTALEVARKEEHWEVVSLLERFMANPTQTRQELRVKLGVPDELPLAQ